MRSNFVVEIVSRHHVAERDDRLPEARLHLVELLARRVSRLANRLIPAVHPVDDETQSTLCVVEIEVDEELALPVARLDRRLFEQPLALCQ